MSEPYAWAWRRIAKAVIKEHVARHGWVCPGFQVPAHPVAPGSLTGDHVIPLAEGGASTAANCRPLCLPCNVRRSNARRLELGDPATINRSHRKPPAGGTKPSTPTFVG